MNIEDYDVADIDMANVSIESTSQNVPTYDSKKLCEIIVCSRYFGNYKELSISCMEELSKRRIRGDDFDFETYIETSFNELPKIETSIPDVGTVLRQLAGQVGKK